MGPVRRLSAADASNLSYETAAAPLHIGTIAALEGGPLTDATGVLRMSLIKRRLERRLSLLPQLRRRPHSPGFLGGRPIWVDDPGFSIDNHVFQRAASSPGEEAALVTTAERILRSPLGREHAPWGDLVRDRSRRRSGRAGAEASPCDH